MFYWLIPYLVAYNSSDVGNWKYGPEHVFKVEARIDLVKDGWPPVYTNYDILMPCRPINASAIQCRIESASCERWKVGFDGYRYPADPLIPRKMPSKQVFEIAFNEDGVETIRLSNDSDDSQLRMIRDIVAPVDAGIDLSKIIYKYSNDTGNGCETNVNVSNSVKSGETTWKPGKTIDGYNFAIPALDETTTDRPIFIEREKDLNKCGNGFLDPLTPVSFSRRMIALGGKSFSAYRREMGMMQVPFPGEIPGTMFVKFNEIMRVSLDSIRPATEELRSMESLTNAGEDDASGTRWTENGDPGLNF